MKKLDRVGEKHITNEGYEVTIIEYNNANNCTIQFENGYILKNIRYEVVKDGRIKNPYHKSVLGVGFFGTGLYKTTENGKITNSHQTWKSMLQRCYSEKCKAEHPTYKDCTVAEEWKCFQNFAEWFEKNWKLYMQNWQLDKDILIKDNKTYSPETCCFVPNEINKLFTKRQNKRGKYPIGVQKEGIKFKVQLSSLEKPYLGSYETIEEAFEVSKRAKEERIKEVADKWKDQITKEVYQAMYNYQVEITD